MNPARLVQVLFQTRFIIQNSRKLTPDDLHSQKTLPIPQQSGARIVKKRLGTTYVPYITPYSDACSFLFK